MLIKDNLSAGIAYRQFAIAATQAADEAINSFPDPSLSLLNMDVIGSQY